MVLCKPGAEAQESQVAKDEETSGASQGLKLGEREPKVKDTNLRSSRLEKKKLANPRSHFRNQTTSPIVDSQPLPSAAGQKSNACTTPTRPTLTIRSSQLVSCPHLCDLSTSWGGDNRGTISDPRLLCGSIDGWKGESQNAHPNSKREDVKTAVKRPPAQRPRNGIRILSVKMRPSRIERRRRRRRSGKTCRC